MTAFPPNVEIWRDQILKYVPSPQGGVDYWLGWMQKESAGNPCSYTYLHESGLFQLMPPGNTTAGGTTEAALRTACVGGSQQIARPLTDDEIREQMVSFQRYLDTIIAEVKAKLAQTGTPWTESTPGFWQLVKLEFNYPAPIASWLVGAQAQLGRPPGNWLELRSTISGYATVLDNAEFVGQFGSASWQIPLVVGLLAAGGLVYYLWRKRR